MKNFCLIFLSILIVSCGKKSETSNSSLEGASFALNSEKDLLSLVLKDQFIACYNYHEDQEVFCWNKNNKSPIFIDLNDNGEKKVIKILPQEEITVAVKNLMSLERMQLEECNQADRRTSCQTFDQKQT